MRSTICAALQKAASREPMSLWQSLTKGWNKMKTDTKASSLKEIAKKWIASDCEDLLKCL